MSLFMGLPCLTDQDKIFEESKLPCVPSASSFYDTPPTNSTDTFYTTLGSTMTNLQKWVADEKRISESTGVITCSSPLPVPPRRKRPLILQSGCDDKNKKGRSTITSDKIVFDFPGLTLTRCSLFSPNYTFTNTTKPVVSSVWTVEDIYVSFQLCQRGQEWATIFSPSLKLPCINEKKRHLKSRAHTVISNVEESVSESVSGVSDVDLITLSPETKEVVSIFDRLGHSKHHIVDDKSENRPRLSVSQPSSPPLTPASPQSPQSPPYSEVTPSTDLVILDIQDYEYTAFLEASIAESERGNDETAIHINKEIDGKVVCSDPDISLEENTFCHIFSDASNITQVRHYMRQLRHFLKSERTTLPSCDDVQKMRIKMKTESYIRKYLWEQNNHIHYIEPRVNSQRSLSEHNLYVYSKRYHINDSGPFKLSTQPSTDNVTDKQLYFQHIYSSTMYDTLNWKSTSYIRYILTIMPTTNFAKMIHYISWPLLRGHLVAYMEANTSSKSQSIKGTQQFIVKNDFHYIQRIVLGYRTLSFKGEQRATFVEFLSRRRLHISQQYAAESLYKWIVREYDRQPDTIVTVLRYCVSWSLTHFDAFFRRHYQPSVCKPSVWHPLLDCIRQNMYTMTTLLLFPWIGDDIHAAILIFIYHGSKLMRVSDELKKAQIRSHLLLSTFENRLRKVSSVSKSHNDKDNSHPTDYTNVYTASTSSYFMPKDESIQQSMTKLQTLFDDSDTKQHNSAVVDESTDNAAVVDESTEKRSKQTMLQDMASTVKTCLFHGKAMVLSTTDVMQSFCSSAFYYGRMTATVTIPKMVLFSETSEILKTRAEGQVWITQEKSLEHPVVQTHAFHLAMTLIDACGAIDTLCSQLDDAITSVISVHDFTRNVDCVTMTLRAIISLCHHDPALVPWIWLSSVTPLHQRENKTMGNVSYVIRRLDERIRRYLSSSTCWMNIDRIVTAPWFVFHRKWSNLHQIVQDLNTVFGDQSKLESFDFSING